MGKTFKTMGSILRNLDTIGWILIVGFFVYKLTPTTLTHVTLGCSVDSPGVMCAR